MSETMRLPTVELGSSRQTRTGETPSMRKLSLENRRDYRFYCLIAYPLFLVVAIIGAVLPFGRSQKTQRRTPTIFHKAAEDVHSIMPWVFHGR